MVVLVVGFLTLVGLARAGSILFWHVRARLPGTGAGQPALLSATVLLLASAWR
jgi:multicomponent K+:H+ antiporter subunit D